MIASSIFGGTIRLIHLRLDGVVKEPVTGFYQEIVDCMWQGLLPEVSPRSSIDAQQLTRSA